MVCRDMSESIISLTGYKNNVCKKETKISVVISSVIETRSKKEQNRRCNHKIRENQYPSPAQLA